MVVGFSDIELKSCTWFSAAAPTSAQLNSISEIKAFEFIVLVFGVAPKFSRACASVVAPVPPQFMGVAKAEEQRKMQNKVPNIAFKLGFTRKKKALKNSFKMLRMLDFQMLLYAWSCRLIRERNFAQILS